ncbi:MAG TPA: hypothetical protein VJB34_10595 [Bdellovibrionota bacterium]|nr:hypothetical protein [Bdellovibrionota bacterium]
MNTKKYKFIKILLCFVFLSFIAACSRGCSGRQGDESGSASSSGIANKTGTVKKHTDKIKATEQSIKNVKTHEVSVEGTKESGWSFFSKRINVQVCAYTIDGNTDGNVTTNGTVFSELGVNIKLDGLPKHYFKRWKDFGWQSKESLKYNTPLPMYDIPIKISGKIHHKQTEALLHSAKDATRNFTPSDPIPTFRIKPEGANAYLRMLDSDKGFGFSIIDNKNNVGYSGIIDAGFYQTLWRSIADKQSQRGRLAVSGPLPTYTDVSICIPIRKTENKWHYISSGSNQCISIPKVPINVLKVRSLGSRSSSMPLYNPKAGCFEKLPPSERAWKESVNFNPSSNKWWVQHWTTPRE